MGAEGEPEPMAKAAAVLELPAGWQAMESKSHAGTVYFFNEFSRVSRWEKPSKDRRLPQKAGARHILLKHSGSRNPTSRRTNGKIERTAEEAIAKLEELREQVLQDKGKFEELAKEYSDCSSFKRGGDLGRFGKRKMQPEFEHATFHLDVGEVSGIIETDSGFHIILRTS